MKIKLLFSSWTGRACLIPVLVFPTLSSIQISLLILLGAFILDFLTGWFASYMEIKRGEKPMPPSGYCFESIKARESIVKAVMYIAVILGSLALEYMFFDKKFEFTNLSSKRLGVTEIVVGFCVAIEFYSTIVENMKRAGYDVVKAIEGIASTIGNIATTIWNLIKKIKGHGQNNA